MLFLLILCVFLPCFDSQYSPSVTNPPHGCPNYGLCLKPTYTYSFPSMDKVFYCLYSNCQCNEGTTGYGCLIVDTKCTGNPCSSFGPNFDCEEGISNYTCVCSSGWTGENCDIDMNSICSSSPCFNGATCISTDDVTYTCNCTDGFVGTKCQYADPCDPSPCQNGATCSELWGGADYYCDCADGYQGKECQSTSVQWSASTKEGCFDYTSQLEDPTKYHLYTDADMTISKCRDYMQSMLSPVYTMYTLVQTGCYLSNTSYLNATSAYGGGDTPCKTNCPGSSAKCGKSGSRAILYTTTVSSDPYDCASLSTSTCYAYLGRGRCIDTLDSDNGGYVCSCKPPYQLPNCASAVDPCSSSPCNVGTCTSDISTMTYKCECPSGYTGENCEYLLACPSSPCMHGGTCIENGDGTYTCECLQYYFGTNCESADVCVYREPCQEGTCSWLDTGINTNYSCTCEPGYTGVDCDTETNECIPYQCQNSAPCVDLFLDYECQCPTGTSGKNCEINLPDCVEYTDEDGNVWPNRCVTRDSNAICNDLINGFTCNCTEGWTDEFCDMKQIIKDVLTIVFGEDGGDNKLLIPLLEDLLNNPAQIKDMVPFIIGTNTYDERVNLSWTSEDLFQWATYEEKVLDLDKDLKIWNDVVLGNCFTFNHRDTELIYNMRTSGKEGGFRTLMNVRVDEFQPWFDTAAIMVFVHNENEYIFSESVRYNAEPNGEMEIFVSDTRFTRLDGKYGVCVRDPSEVNAYYYEGMYTTDGCLRSCYQDMIYDSCGCMDPRYPYPEEKESCQVIDMTCVENATDIEGDPSTWESCKCPLPCENQQYSVRWSRATNRIKPIECDIGGTMDSDCLANTTDSVLISVILPVMNFQTYAEEPAMDLNRFISNLGGLLGVLMGVGIIWFIEVCFLAFHLTVILIRGR